MRVAVTSKSPSSDIASPTTLTGVRAAIGAWYASAHRDFPWRQTRDPWAVLVSEVMLQQTQARRIAERFPAFIAQFPTPTALASASDAEVLAAWAGLGYNRRALALRRAAGTIASAGWPKDVAGLERLPGVGPYTARAVASLAFGLAVGVVDTNVRRWLVRRFGIKTDAPASSLQPLADLLASGGGNADPAAWTHATMEFGAAVCRSREPRCDACPIANGCPSRGAPARVPVPRQPPFSGSDRASRGALLRALVAAPGRAVPLATVRARLAATNFERIVAGLERDGLAHRHGRRLRLGGGADAVSDAATIGP